MESYQYGMYCRYVRSTELFFSCRELAETRESYLPRLFTLKIVRLQYVGGGGGGSIYL